MNDYLVVYQVIFPSGGVVTRNKIVQRNEMNAIDVRTLESEIGAEHSSNSMSTVIIMILNIQRLPI